MARWHRIVALSLPLLVAGALLAAAPAQAGCGCDHPPPSWAPLMPPFASPGKTVSVHAAGFEYQVGMPYEVDFGGGAKTFAIADDISVLEAALPPGANPGPAEVKVKGPGVDHAFDASLFTVLAPAPVVPPGTGAWVLRDFEISVTEDGTLLIPFNLEQVLEATQFAFQLGETDLAFGHDDVVFYNEDGVDLTLFTLNVEDPTERQWGSYHGWEVERDTGLRNRVFQNRVLRPLAFLTEHFALSDMLTYWRHEFHTYKDAHAPGGSHEVGPDGRHVHQGTLHVDHDHLVLAIAGRVDDGSGEPGPLGAGAQTADLFVATVLADNPVEPDEMLLRLMNAVLFGDAISMGIELPSVYDDDDDDDED